MKRNLPTPDEPNADYARTDYRAGVFGPVLRSLFQRDEDGIAHLDFDPECRSCHRPDAGVRFCTRCGTPKHFWV